MRADEKMTRLASLRTLRQRVDAEIESLTTDLERVSALTSERGKFRRPKAICGTDSGYYRHLRTLHEPACDDCLKAHANVERERWIRRQAAVLEMNEEVSA